MIFCETPLKGSFVLDLDKREDERGFFARAFCKGEFEQHSLESRIVQSNLSYSRSEGTLRGMHYQAAPHEETKLVRCIRGAIYDVIIDLRPDSATRLKWFGVELTAENHRMLFVPAGFAHGFQTLEKDCEVFYEVSEFYSSGAERGIRWNDPLFQIRWPIPETSVISAKDANWPDYRPSGTASDLASLAGSRS
jgi:dTDP-4-dehydrorhamnose 3,5-epimerase